jgi:cytochrome c biogenesis protein CcdA
MDTVSLLSLAVLALIDSTSFGTLGIPLLLIVAARAIRARPLGVYFATVVVFYFVIGVLFLFGVDALFDRVSDALNTRAGGWSRLVAGAGMVLVSFRIDTGSSKDKPGRNWIPGSDANGAMVMLGLTAAVIEVASMLPYLSVIGVLSSSSLAMPSRIGVLALYCVVMILPALVIVLIARLIGERLWPRLERISAWIQKNTAETVAWIVGIIGFLIAQDAARHLELLS